MAEGLVSTAAPAGLGAEAVGLLQRMIRADTANPPGSERRLQEELRDLLAAAGFACELLAAEPERPNLVARLSGSAQGPTLTLLGHVDTVRADPEEWARDPWSGELVDDEIWGRGALDMKGQVACEVAAAIELARSGWRPAAGELLLVITADEETGGALGARWLCREHPDRVRSDYVVNEGGGSAVELSGRRMYTLCRGEKGVFRFLLRARGVAGHASMPRIGENALVNLIPALARLSEQPPSEPTPEGLEFLSVLLDEEVEAAGLETALERLRSEAPLLADFMAEPMLGVTVSPTVARASEQANVIPSQAEVLVDCRVPPGMEEEEVRTRVEALLGETEHELQFVTRIVGNRSPLGTPLADAIRGWVGETDPGAGLVPILMPGFSDSNPFREAFPEAVVYGFCPAREMDLVHHLPLMHAADERVPVSDVELAAGFYWDLARRMLG